MAVFYQVTIWFAIANTFSEKNAINWTCTSPEVKQIPPTVSFLYAVSLWSKYQDKCYCKKPTGLSCSRNY